MLSWLGSHRQAALAIKQLTALFHNVPLYSMAKPRTLRVTCTDTCRVKRCRSIQTLPVPVSE